MGSPFSFWGAVQSNMTGRVLSDWPYPKVFPTRGLLRGVYGAGYKSATLLIYERRAMKILLSVLFSFALCLPALAQNLFVDSQEGCDIVMGSPDGDLDYASEGGLLLHETGYSSLEYFCSFSPPALYQWQVYDVTTHVGHCEMPGPEFLPQLFTILRDPEAPGVISIFTGEDEPLRFFACSS